MIQKKKQKLMKLAKQCTDIAESHRRKKYKFEELFEEIYGVEFTGEMDGVVECTDYGNADLTLEQLEEEIYFQATSCNGNYDKAKIKNIDALAVVSEQKEKSE